MMKVYQGDDMSDRVMVVDGDVGEIYSWPGAGNPEWKTVIDDPESLLDCTVLHAEAMIVISKMGWTILGTVEEEHPDSSYSSIYVRTYKEYEDLPNPWAACKPEIPVV
jgi:hypothetical protein